MSGVTTPVRAQALVALRAWLVCGLPPRPGEVPADAIVDEAVTQGLAGLLAGALEGTAWPDGLRARLEARRRALLFRGVQQLDMLAWAQDLLAGEGLRSLPLKGAALAEELYDSVADRPMCDVDLLALDDFDDSLRLLEARGLRRVDVGDHAVALCGAGGVILELHRSITSCPGLFSADGEALWARSRQGRGQVPRLPSREDLLVELALHAAFQHGLCLSLVQYLDFRRLLERPLDLERIDTIAAAMGAEAALAAALEAAAVLVAAPVPEALRLALAPALAPRDRRWLAAWLSVPERCLAPREPPLARLRWMVAAGRRRALVRGTFSGRGRGSARRAFALAARWGMPSLRQLLPAVRRPRA